MSSVNLYYQTSCNHDHFNIRIAGKDHKKVVVLNENGKKVYKLPHREVVDRIAWNASGIFETEDTLGVIRRFHLETGETIAVFKPDSLLSEADKAIAPHYRKIDLADIIKPIVIPTKEVESCSKFTAKVLLDD